MGAGLPDSFQWFGLSQSAYPLVAVTVVAVLFVAIGGVCAVSRRTGDHATDRIGAARLAGLDVATVKAFMFAAAGASPRRPALYKLCPVQSDSEQCGIGLEMKVIAAVVVGGVAIRGGRGNVAGTLLGLILLGAIGPALTYLGVSAYWERAIHGAIILTAVAFDAARAEPLGRVGRVAAARA